MCHFAYFIRDIHGKCGDGLSAVPHHIITVDVIIFIAFRIECRIIAVMPVLHLIYRAPWAGFFPATREFKTFLSAEIPIPPMFECFLVRIIHLPGLPVADINDIISKIHKIRKAIRFLCRIKKLCIHQRIPIKITKTFRPGPDPDKSFILMFYPICDICFCTGSHQVRHISHHVLPVFGNNYIACIIFCYFSIFFF